MAIWGKVIRAVIVSVGITLAAMALMSRLPGLEIPAPYWVLGTAMPLLLSASISYAQARQSERISRLNAELVTAYGRMKMLAETDQLTGLANRAAFLAVAEQLQQQQPGRILIIDLDHFKAINDTHGHAVGDRVLRSIAQSLRRDAESGDLVGRVGGEEFAIFLPGADDITAVARAEQLRAGIEKVLIFDREGGPIRITASIGISGQDSASLPDAVQAADMAMYRAKRAGRNRVRVAALAHCHRQAKSASGGCGRGPQTPIPLVIQSQSTVTVIPNERGVGPALAMLGPSRRRPASSR